MLQVKHSIALVALALLCGCGTVTSRTKGPVGPYCGFGYDMERVTSGDEWLDWSIQGSAGSVPFLLPRGLLWVLDTPLSLVSDTLLLPFDTLQHKNPEADAQPEVAKGQD